MKRTRAGMGLIEVLIAMAIATAMLAVLAATVSRMMRASNDSRRHLQTVVTLGRLGEQLRRDVRAAQSATADPDDDKHPTRLVLGDDAERTVSYEDTDEGMARVVKQAGEPERRDVFVLDGLKFGGWEVDLERREVALVLARLARADTESDAENGRFQLSATLARPASEPKDADAAAEPDAPAAEPDAPAAVPPPEEDTP